MFLFTFLHLTRSASRIYNNVQYHEVGRYVIESPRTSNLEKINSRWSKFNMSLLFSIFHLREDIRQFLAGAENYMVKGPLFVHIPDTEDTIIISYLENVCDTIIRDCFYYRCILFYLLNIRQRATFATSTDDQQEEKVTITEAHAVKKRLRILVEEFKDVCRFIVHQNVVSLFKTKRFNSEAFRIYFVSNATLTIQFELNAEMEAKVRTDL